MNRRKVLLQTIVVFVTVIILSILVVLVDKDTMATYNLKLNLIVKFATAIIFGVVLGSHHLKFIWDKSVKIKIEPIIMVIGIMFLLMAASMAFNIVVFTNLVLTLKLSSSLIFIQVAAGYILVSSIVPVNRNNNK